MPHPLGTTPIFVYLNVTGSDGGYQDEQASAFWDTRHSQGSAQANVPFQTSSFHNPIPIPRTDSFPLSVPILF